MSEERVLVGIGDVRSICGEHLADRADDEIEQRVNAARQASPARKTDLGEAERFVRSHENAWQRVSAAIQETRNLAAAPEGAGPEERRILFDD